MRMTLGDFFASAPHCRPVNPRPCTFTASSKGNILPGGHANPKRKQIAAEITGCFVFIGGDEVQEARIEARKALRSRFIDKETKLPLPLEDGDFGLELTYQLIAKVLCVWDPDEKEADEPLFADIDVLRQLVKPKEAERILQEYNAYVEDEHPSPKEEHFRGNEEASPRMVVAKPR